MAAHSAINTFIFLKKLRKKIIFCWNQFTGKAINSGKPLIKKNTQTFHKMWDALAKSRNFAFGTVEKLWAEVKNPRLFLHQWGGGGWGGNQ